MDVKNIAIGVGIFGAGIGVGHFVTKARLLQQYKEDLIEIKQFYVDKVTELGVMPLEFVPDDILEVDEDKEEVEETDEETAKQSKDYADKVSKYSSGVRQEPGAKGKPIIKYNKPPLQIEDWGDLEEDLEEDEEEDEMDRAYEAELAQRAEEYAQRRYENKMGGRPYCIGFEEFEDAPDDYDVVTLFYYAKDRTLCEDDDEEVEDEEGLVGFDYEDTLDMQTTAWVRNDILMTIYEIHRVDESYQQAVVNARETPKEREARISRRRK